MLKASDKSHGDARRYFPREFFGRKCRASTTMSNHDCCKHMQISRAVGHRRSVQGALSRQMWKEVITTVGSLKSARQQWHLQSRGTTAHIRQNMKGSRPQFITKQLYNSLARANSQFSSVFESLPRIAVPFVNSSTSRSYYFTCDLRGVAGRVAGVQVKNLLVSPPLREIINHIAEGLLAFLQT